MLEFRLHQFGVEYNFGIVGKELGDGAADLGVGGGLVEDILAGGTVAVVVSAIRVMAEPPSTLARVTAAWVSIFSGVSPAPPNCAPRAMEKQPAWAAAISSSGVVPLAAPSKRVAKE
jgi:hypothetical protein